MSGSSSKNGVAKATEVGFPSKYFVNRPPDSLLCGLCLEVLNNPFQCPNGHCFCKDCIVEALELRTLCPICNISTPSFSNFNANIVARDVIEYLPTKCHTEPVKAGLDFCPWTGPFQQRNDHIKKCQYQLTECRNLDCPMKVQKKNLTHHLLHECPKRSIKCEFCSRSMIFDTLNQHYKTCSERLAAKSAQLKAALLVPSSVSSEVSPITINTPTVPTLSVSTPVVPEAKPEVKTGSPTRRKRPESTTHVNAPSVTEVSSGRSSRSASSKNSTRTKVYPYRWPLIAVISAAVVGLALQQIPFLRHYFPHDPNIHSFSDSLVYFKYFLYRYLNPSNEECGNGYCMFQFESNDIYIGNWKDYSMHGQGYYQFNASGDVYIGAFDKDLMHGYGVYSGRLGTYEGNWHYGTRSGSAVFSYPNGDIYSGTFHENMFNGFGNLTYSGSQYLGNFYNDMFHGAGEFRFPNGDRYQGNWEYNIRTGLGIMTYSDGSEYTGEFRENARNGRGMMRWSNGDVYDGEYLHDMMNGEGVMVYANGDEYRGHWQANMRHGYGEFRAKGIVYVYEGDWFENRRHGFGRMWNEVGMYEGDFTADAVTGQGTYTYHESSSFTGGVQNGLREGAGTYRTSTGIVYEGQWAADQLVGECRIEYPSGDHYVGICQDMSMIKGTMHYSNGDRYEGEFFNNQRHGVGRYYSHSTGETYYGHFEHDDKIGEGHVIDAKGKVISGSGASGSGSSSSGTNGGGSAGVDKRGSGSAGKTGSPTTSQHSSKSGQKPITGHKRVPGSSGHH